MVDRCHIDARALDPLAVVARYLQVGGNQLGRGYSSEAYDDLRSDRLYLRAQVGDARILLLGERIAVLRRPAFEDVRYIYVVPVDVHRVEITVEELPRRSDAKIISHE